MLVLPAPVWLRAGLLPSQACWLLLPSAQVTRWQHQLQQVMCVMVSCDSGV